MFLTDPGNFDALGYASFVVADRYCTLLYPGRSACGREKRGNSCSMCAYAFGEGTLRYKFEGYLSLEIKLLKVLIPEKEEPSRI